MKNIPSSFVLPGNGPFYLHMIKILSTSMKMFRGSRLSLYLPIILLYACVQSQGRKNVLPPDPNRFTVSVLSAPGALDEPMAFTFLNEDEMLIVERKGGVKAFDVNSQEVSTAGQVLVNVQYVNKEGEARAAEEGLMGVIAHPDYENNHWVYMLYADPDEPKHVLARWVYKDDSLHQASRKVLLEYPAQREVCCHTGGGMAFDPEGNLYITTGNNTANPPRGTSNLDERPGYENADDQRTAGNTNDLRGKILRIHPEDNGSYSIPEGNLFAEGTPKTRPEIYTMGHRNPWRVSVDSETGYIYWGEVGPDASEDTEFGPRGYDEFNQAKRPGFFGWPYFIGDNQAYVDYDFETDSLGEPFSVEQVVNNSPNNTGLTELPEPEEAFIWYPYSYSDTFPSVGSSGRSATGGPVFRQADFPESDQRFPDYFEGKWFIVEFMRGWIMAVSMDENGDYLAMEPFMPQENFSSAIDMQFSPDGDLYVLEYGSAWFRGNENAQIKRIRYNGGNRMPVVQAGAEQVAGAVPFNLKLSSEGTVDYDNDPLTYAWTLASEDGSVQRFDAPNPELTLEQPGVYQVELLVTDEAGKSNSQQFEVVAGNEPPQVDIVLADANQSFFFAGTELNYQIVVSDDEDGSTVNGKIQPEAIAVNFDYAPEGFDLIAIAQNHKSSDDWVVLSRGKSLIGESDCLSCHREDVRSIGPSYQEVAQKYKADPQAPGYLAERIIKGSVGVWGEHAMSAHPNLSEEDARSMVDYILSLDEKQVEQEKLLLQGTFVAEVPAGENGKGGYLLRAAYTDRGNEGVKALSGEKIIALRNPVLSAEQYDMAQGTQLLTTPRRSFNINEHQGYVAYQNLDLTGIREIDINAEAPGRADAAGGVIELRLDSPEGELLGTTEMITPLQIDFRAELQKMREEWEKNGQQGPRPGFGDVIEKFRKTYVIPVNDVRGFHDVYFVVKNPAAKPGQILLQMHDFTFKNQSPGL